VNVPVQVGGGLRDDESVRRMLDGGAARVIIGTRAVEDGAWRRRMADACPARLVVAADVRDGFVVTRGWQRATSYESTSFLQEMNAEPLAGVLVTDVSREGQMLGIDEPLFAGLVRSTTLPLIAAGGIRDIADLRALARAGAAGAVLGMALYRGGLDTRRIAAEYTA
jgi:phosphoribosylformimino-5-aminoimidazole carboxamide ribotide isomerase